MDKYEYKVRADEIKALIAEGEYAEAVKIADTIDWRRVKSVMMLCTISDLYKINRRYEDSRDILLLAYEKHTGGRLIVYSLCELSIKLEEYVQAIEYYKEFVQLAPKDTGRYILQYKLYEAQEVSLEERIAVLEEFKKKDYREKWAYELAYLYHRVGLETKCVEECDEMFLWFGDGRYVLKALELKMLHQPLTEEQQLKYEQMKQTGGIIESEYAAEGKAIQEEAVGASAEEEDDEFSREVNVLTDPTQELPTKEELDDIQVKTIDVSQYNTINLQKELAESMKEFLENNPTVDMPVAEVNDAISETQIYEAAEEAQEEVTDETVMWPAEEIQVQEPEEADEEEMAAEAGDTLIWPAKEVQKAVAEPAEELQGVQAEQPIREVRQDTDEMQLISDADLGIEQEEEKPVAEEVFFGNTSEVNIEEVVSELAEKNAEEVRTTIYQNVLPGMPPEIVSAEIKAEGVKAEKEVQKEPVAAKMPEASPNPALSNTGIIRTFHKPSGYDNILSQEYDGQISLVVPEEEKVEKQITGQLSIDDIMAEWEKIKKENEKRRMEEIKERVQKQTTTLFADFDESTKSGLLEELEKAMLTAAMKEEKKRAEEGRPRVIKVSDIDKQQAEEERLVQEVQEAAEESLEVVEEAVKAEADYVASAGEAAALAGAAALTGAMSAEQEEAESEEAEQFFEEAEEAALEAQASVEEELQETAEEMEALSEEIMEDNEEDMDNVEVIFETDETLMEDGSVWAEVERDTDEIAEDEEESDLEMVEEDVETANDEAGEAESEEENSEEVQADGNQKYQAREMTQAEREQFAPFIHHKRTRRQIVEAIDNISMAAHTGNVVITGEEGTGTTALAKLLVKEIQLADSNFSGKVAKISGTTMNKKDVATTLDKLEGGALIIEGATAMKKATVESLVKELNQEDKGIVILLEDSKQPMNEFLAKFEALQSLFNLRVDVEALDDQTLVKYAKKYALDQEYVIDELGILALHTRIADMQTSDHEVTLAEIEEMVDDAIYYADRKTPGHFFDILFGKRYDEEDMVILREKDFMHY